VQRDNTTTKDGLLIGLNLAYNMTSNISAVFQQFINNVFSDLNACIIVYLNYILIYLDNLSKHWGYVKEVLYQLHKARLYTKAEKCKFHSDLVEYLRYILFSSKIIMVFNKIKNIQEWPELKE